MQTKAKVNKKYSSNFTRDFNWYLSMRHQFNFSGDILRDKKGDALIIISDPIGISGQEAFWVYDSAGTLPPTKHPNILFAVLKAKASANFHVKMFSQDRITGMLSRFELDEILKEIKAPDWFAKAIENLFPHMTSKSYEGISNRVRG